jgi:hypothetical protein
MHLLLNLHHTSELGTSILAQEHVPYNKRARRRIQGKKLYDVERMKN